MAKLKGTMMDEEEKIAVDKFESIVERDSNGLAGVVQLSATECN